MSRSSFALNSPVKYKTARLSSKLSSLSEKWAHADFDVALSVAYICR